jgi:hypothetical protein
MDSLVAQQIARQGAYIFLDATLDRDRQDMLAYLHRREGSLTDFRVFNPDRPEESHTYNPLARGTALEVAARLVEALMSPMYGEGACPREMQREAIQLLTLLVQALRERDTVASMALLHEVLGSPEALSALIDSPKVWEVTRHALRGHITPHRRGDAYDMSAIKAPLARVLSVLPMFVAGKLSQVVNAKNPDIDLDDVLRTRKGLFIMLPTMGKDRSCIALGRLLMADLTDSLVCRSASKIHPIRPAALVVAVETPILSTGHLKDAVRAARAARITFVAGVASASGLKVLSEADQASLLGPDATQVFFRASPHTKPDELRHLGQTIAESHGVPSVSTALEQLRAQPEGVGLVVRRKSVTSFEPWPTKAVTAE